LKRERHVRDLVLTTRICQSYEARGHIRDDAIAHVCATPRATTDTSTRMCGTREARRRGQLVWPAGGAGAVSSGWRAGGGRGTGTLERGRPHAHGHSRRCGQVSVSAPRPQGGLVLSRVCPPLRGARAGRTDIAVSWGTIVCVNKYLHLIRPRSDDAEVDLDAARQQEVSLASAMRVTRWGGAGGPQGGGRAGAGRAGGRSVQTA
jgi:hypothetical protein